MSKRPAEQNPHAHKSESQIDHTVEVILRRERSGRPLCIKTDRSGSELRTLQIDPERALKIGPMNGR